MGELGILAKFFRVPWPTLKWLRVKREDTGCIMISCKNFLDCFFCSHTRVLVLCSQSGKEESKEIISLYTKSNSSEKMERTLMSHAYQYNVCMSEGMCMLWFNFILAGVDSFATYAYDCRIIFSVFLGLKTIKNSSGQLPRSARQ